MSDTPESRGTEKNDSGSSRIYSYSRSVPFPEYDVVFEPWNLRFAQSVLTSLVNRQERGGVRVQSFRLVDDENVLAVVVEHYGNETVCQGRVGVRLDLAKLRQMVGDDSPVSAASIYLEDVTMPPSYFSDAHDPDDTLWVDLPPSR